MKLKTFNSILIVPVRFILILQITFTKQSMDAIQHVRLQFIIIVLHCVSKTLLNQSFSFLPKPFKLFHNKGFDFLFW